MIYSVAYIVMLLSLKVIFPLAFRQLAGFSESILTLMGVDLKVPSYTQIEPIIPPRGNAMFQLDKESLPTDHPRNKALEIIDEGDQEANRKGWKIQSDYHRRSISENAFFRWKTILSEKMYVRVFENQKTEAAIKAAVLNKFIQITAPIAVKVA